MIELTKARVKLLLREPFFGHLALSVTLFEDTQQETMYTDGIVVGYNPAFVKSLTADELIGVFAHEILHNAFLHPFRRNSRDHTKWNHACDYAINGILLNHKFTLPKDRLHNPKFEGMSAEEIYNLLPDIPAGNAPAWGQVRDPDKSKNLKELENDWIINVKQAAEAEKSIGKQSEAASRAYKAATPKVNWRSQLNQLAAELVKTDYAWYPPNQLYLSRKLHVPTLNEPGLGEIVIAIDTSGSIDNDLLSKFAAESNSIFQQMRPRKITVIYCDSSINRIDEFEDGEVKFEPCGGGGTDFNAVFDYVSKNIEPTALLYFTDLEVYSDGYPRNPPDYPVFWVRTSKQQAPWGMTVDLFTEKE